MPGPRQAPRSSSFSSIPRWCSSLDITDELAQGRRHPHPWGLREPGHRGQDHGSGLRPGEQGPIPGGVPGVPDRHHRVRPERDGHVKGANSTEFDAGDRLPGGRPASRAEACHQEGGHACAWAPSRWWWRRTARPSSSTAPDLIMERHRHRYEVNPKYIERARIGRLEVHRTLGRRRASMEIGELDAHPYYVACQFHPEFKSRPNKPSPLHLGLLRAAIKHRFG